MTFLEMQQRLDDRISGHGGLVWNATKKKRYINDGYTEFARMTHILWKQSTVTVTADVGQFAFPTAVTGVESILQVWRADWDGQVLTPRSTRWMDRYYGKDWRDAVGSEPTTILTDSADRSKIRIYPMVDTTALVGSKVLTLEYSYIPTDMSADADTCALSAVYALAPVEYAVWQCLEDAVQSKQNPAMGDRAKIAFWNLVGSAKAEVNRGMFHNYDTHVIPPVY